MYEAKEKAEGYWDGTGTTIKFTRTFRGHRFTDEEVAKLLNSETIDVNLTSKGGKTYTVYGKLTEQEYEGYPFIGFEALGFVNRVPNSWGNHVFTPEEKQTLAHGGSVTFSTTSKTTGKPFTCDLMFGAEDGKTKLVPKFHKGNT